MRTNVTIISFVPGNESAWERNVPVPVLIVFETNKNNVNYSLWYYKQFFFVFGFWKCKILIK